MPNLGHWLWYWLQLPGCPSSAPRESADVIVVQAFGRNTLLDGDLANLRQHHNQHGSNDALTLAWCRDHVEVGGPNRCLAMELMNLVHHTHLPVIAQWEVIVSLPASWYANHQAQVICLWPSATSGEYFSTRDVLVQSLVAMSWKGWNQPMVLAHSGQAMRVAMMMRRLTGDWPVIAPQLTGGFDRDSVQPWTRNRPAWLVHEFLARGHHLLHRWV